ncbi:MAG: DUF3987 domain-containing protein [Deltaproteobacteria bacterium]|nr:DUF3987 domain-containing protein [Deltaproteobacteria bacterium]
MKDRNENMLLRNALDYAEFLNWPVFPCKLDKTPHVKNWPAKATTNRGLITGFWERWPKASIGMVTGVRSGVFVLDIDLPDGPATLESLENEHGRLPATVEQQTGKGGRHLFFKMPGDVIVKNSVSKLGKGLDVRGEGGYVILPLSKHPDGPTYKWVNDPNPEESRLAEAPNWLLELLSDNKVDSQPSSRSKTTRYGGAALQDESAKLSKVPEGQRNDALNRSAFAMGQLVASGDLAFLKARASLVKAGKSMGLEDAEIRRTVDSGLNEGRKKPRNGDSPGDVPSEKPRPLFRELPPSKPFPIKALGPSLKKTVLAIVDIVQVPNGLAAGSVLATASLVVQRFADIVLPIGVGATKPLSLYMITIAESSDRKTTADILSLRAIEKFEAELNQKHKKELLEYMRRLAAYDEASKIVKKQRRDKSKQEDPNKIVEKIAFGLSQLEDPPQPPLEPHIIVSEPTFAGLIKYLRVGWPAIGIFSNEGGQMIFGHSMQQDFKVATASGLSALWDGQAVKRTRVDDGCYSLLGRRVAIHLMVQPIIAARFLSDTDLADQGLVSRFLITAPESLAGTRKHREPKEHSQEAINQFEAHVLSLLQKPLPETDPLNELHPRGLPLSSDARTRFIRFGDLCEKRIGKGGRYEQIKSFAGKLPEHAARLAGVLTLIEDIDAVEVTEGNMRHGCALASYYAEEHLRLFLAGLIESELVLANDLLEWLKNKWTEEIISLPHIYRYGPKPVRDAKRARQMAKILEDHGYLESIDEGAVVKGEYRREVWRIITG